MISVGLADNLNFSKVREATPMDTSEQPVLLDTKANYEGTIRVYIVEGVSFRWHYGNGDNYKNALLDFAFVEDVDIADGTVWEHQVTWDGVAEGYDNIFESNIQVIAVAFNADWVWADSYDGENPFQAHYVDAAAKATASSRGHNEVRDGFTHTVFIENGSSET